jgi:hypothetical protein
MSQVIGCHAILTMPASNAEKLGISLETVLNEGHMPTSSISTPTQTSPYLMMNYLTLSRIGLAPFRPIWQLSPLTKNNALHRKWAVRIFPMLD